MSGKKIDQILTYAAQQKASDVALMAGSAPYIRLNGEFVPVQMPPLGQNAVKHLLSEMLTPEQSARLQETTNIDLSYQIPNIARFRVNCMMQRLGFGIVARIIPLQVPDLATLGLPDSVVGLLNTPNGLILVTGPSGSGKTTTQAAIIARIANSKKDHVLTVEDPIEFIIRGTHALVNQREVRTHTETFASALKAALREDPDIILIGEMRDRETISLAMTASETGHLVVGTMNTISATATIDRIVDTFPGDQKSQIRVMLSGSLRSIISQQLVKSKSGTERVMAAEIMINLKTVASMIRDGKTHLIKNSMQTGKLQGMITMDDCLLGLAKAGKITPEEAVRNCENAAEMRKNLGMKEGAGHAAH